MEILERLYNGKLRLMDAVIPKDADYRPVSEAVGNGREYFAGKLPEEDREKFAEWNEQVFRYEEMTEYANFTHGFRLGAVMAYEVMNGWEDRKKEDKP